MTDGLTRFVDAEPQRVASRPPKGQLRAAIAVTLLVYLAVVLLMTMSPTPIDRGYANSIEKVLAVLHRNGVPQWFGYSKLEFTANIAMFVPLGLLVGLALPRRIVWLASVLLPAFSCVIELTQATMLSQRFAMIEDVMANSVGGWIGLSIACTFRAIVHAREQRTIARKLPDE